MIGEEYLQVRAQLGTALFSLSTLAHGLEMGRDVLQALHEMRGNMREPFLFVLLGDAKSGKTLLLNALLGRENSVHATGEADGRLRLIKYGPEEKIADAGGDLVEEQDPATLLRDFNFLDTPGNPDPGQEALIRQYLPAAELVLFVFSINHPWSSSAWELLHLVEGKPVKNVIFVLQQSDLRDEFEVIAVTKHLEQTLHEKFSPGCRVFPVSAKKAWLSRTTGTDREGLLQQSGFPALESYINDTVTQSPERSEKLRAICETSQAILSDAGEKSRVTLAFIKKEIEELGEMHLDLGECKEQSLRLAHGILWTIAQSYERLQKHGEQLLQQLLPVPLIPKFGAATREKVPETAEAELQESIQRQIQSAVELLADDLHETWHQLHDSLAKNFPLATVESHTAEFLQDRGELLQSIQSTLAENMSAVHLQWQMTELFTETAEWLQIHRDSGPAAVTAALASFAGGDFSRTLAAAAASAGSVSGLMKRGKIQTHFRAEMARLREELLAVIEEQLIRGIGHLYDETGEALQPLQIFLNAQRAIYEPRVGMVQQMDETFTRAAESLGLQ